MSTLLVGAGWILSACHQLNRLGYGIAFLLALGAWLYRGRGASLHPGRQWRKLRRRFRRPLPAFFLTLALLSLLAGILYVPHNGDTNLYRIPRIFHWLGNEQWHWIHTLDIRMNIAGTGFEWLGAPLILFTGCDRGLFLVNWISYLLLPGLIFSVFIRLGVRRSVSWWWMWLLSSGWCYVWQAQDTGNDSLAVIYALASVDFALRARQSRRPGDWWLAILSAGLMTGVKQTCIPLVLVSFIAIYPGWRTVLARPMGSCAVVAAALLVSVLPVTVFNLHYAGNWMGVSKVAYGWSNAELDSPFWGIVGNTFCLAVQNLKPPVFPWFEQWNAAMAHFVHTPFGSHFQSFEVFGFLEQSASPAQSGIGLGICLVIAVSIWRARAFKRAVRAGQTAPVDAVIRWLWLAPWVALLAFMAKVGSYENARQLAPYYVFFFPVFLAAAGHERLVRQRWWRRLAGAVMVVTILMVWTARATPLFPAQTVFGWLHERHPKSTALAHALASFSSQNDVKIRRYAFHDQLPREEKVVGYYSAAFCEAEFGFWQPFGIRRVERIAPDDTRDYINSLHIHYIILDDETLRVLGRTRDEWLRENDCELVAQTVFNIRWGVPPVHLYLTRLR